MTADICVLCCRLRCWMPYVKRPWRQAKSAASPSTLVRLRCLFRTLAPPSPFWIRLGMPPSLQCGRAVPLSQILSSLLLQVCCQIGCACSLVISGIGQLDLCILMLVHRPVLQMLWQGSIWYLQRVLVSSP